MFILYPCLKSSQNCDAEQGWCTIWSIWILSKRKKNWQHKLSHHDKKLIRLSDKICKKKSGLKKS